MVQLSFNHSSEYRTIFLYKCILQCCTPLCIPINNFRHCRRLRSLSVHNFFSRDSAGLYAQWWYPQCLILVVFVVFCPFIFRLCVKGRKISTISVHSWILQSPAHLLIAMQLFLTQFLLLSWIFSQKASRCYLTQSKPACTHPLQQRAAKKPSLRSMRTWNSIKLGVFLPCFQCMPRLHEVRFF